MATKRMFDKAIIDTDRFMDLSMSSKALYFLLGMEADDEGFVSYKKVMRIHGGNDDDIKILIAKNFIIGFPSGVVVITDWNKNNWLDTRRIKPTEYQKEKTELYLLEDKTYSLSKCLARGEERSIEEKRIEEKKETSKRYLSQIPNEDLEELSDKFLCDSKQIKSKANALLDYCESRGKVYKNYKAFLSNALRKDFGERPPKKPKETYEIIDGVAVLMVEGKPLEKKEGEVIEENTSNLISKYKFNKITNKLEKN
jgi:hypothetical protein